MSGAVKFLPPMPPEKLAYALARYSRSADPVEDSLAWVETHSEERFWETFYFDYGHASIADLGHLAACFEGISELAAIEVLDEQLWDGQARSTRYQNFATTGHVTPPELAGHPLEAELATTVRRLIEAYLEVHQRCSAWLEQRHPRPEDMPVPQYRRNIAARAFDSARYLLPLAIPTNVGQITSIRTLEKQISRLLASPLAEVRALGTALVDGCRAVPAGGGSAPAPTLARHARRNAFAAGLRERSSEIAARRFPGVEPPRRDSAVLVPRVEPAIELLTGLLYEASRLSWQTLATRVASLSAAERKDMVLSLLASRGRHDELPRAARAGHAFIFEIEMDVGGFRDMHRHRRCQQHAQELDLDASCALPPDAEASGIEGRLRQEHAGAVATARRIAESFGPRVAAYALPLMHRVRSVFKMDFAQADYMSRLRTGVKGHPSYRRIAWDMLQELHRVEPELAFLSDGTPPEVEDPLTR